MGPAGETGPGVSHSGCPSPCPGRGRRFLGEESLSAAREAQAGSFAESPSALLSHPGGLWSCGAAGALVIPGNLNTKI